MAHLDATAISATADEEAFIRFLVAQGYTDARLIGGGRYACVLRLIFTGAIIVGRVGQFHGYDDRWCYHSVEDARSALQRWDGTGEPTGWHRHPATGRRIKENGEEEIFL